MYRNKIFLAEMPLGVKHCPPPCAPACGCRHCGHGRPADCGCGCGKPCGYPPLPPPCAPPCGCGCCAPCGFPPPWPKEDYGAGESAGCQPPPPKPKPKPQDVAVYVLRDCWRLPPCAEVCSVEACIDGWEAQQQGCCRVLCVRYHLLICWRERRHMRRTRLESRAQLPWPQGACPGDLLMLVCTPPQLQQGCCGEVEFCTQLRVSW
ncbi:MAG: hypothetical protein IJF62_04050 [Firmicutes bacterium]|nr:hypothetical protein [Bacillota bacterium]